MNRWDDYLRSSIAVLSELQMKPDLARIESAVALMTEALSVDRPLLICGNGGSAADSTHIAGELVGRFLKDRRALNVLALSADSAIITAWANDVGYDQIFARQVEAYGEAGGVLLAISTSGNSKNVLAAAVAAKARGMKTVALTGRGGGKLAALADILLDVPSSSTPLIQQGHLCLYHYICAEIEERIASGGA